MYYRKSETSIEHELPAERRESVYLHPSTSADRKGLLGT